MEPLRQVLVDAGVALAILFGSRASGTARADSDWDVGIIAPNVDQDMLVAKLEEAIGGRVDLVDLRRANPLLCMEAVRKGTVLVDATGSEYAKFASLSLRRYEDTKKLREAQRRSLKNFLAQRGFR